jgi:hypothetical protein
MANPLLPDFLRDIIAIASLVVTIIGFVIAFLQIRRTRSATEAARAAAENALAQSQRSYGHFTVAIAHRMISEIQSHVQKKNWEVGSLRLRDLADQIVQLEGTETDWKKDATKLRKWAEICFRQLDAAEAQTFDREKWSEFFLKLQSKIDSHFRPYLVNPEVGDDT